MLPKMLLPSYFPPSAFNNVCLRSSGMFMVVMAVRASAWAAGSSVASRFADAGSWESEVGAFGYGAHHYVHAMVASQKRVWLMALMPVSPVRRLQVAWHSPWILSWCQ